MDSLECRHPHHPQNISPWPRYRYNGFILRQKLSSLKQTSRHWIISLCFPTKKYISLDDPKWNVTWHICAFSTPPPHIFRDSYNDVIKYDFLDSYWHISEKHNSHLRVASSLRGETSNSERHIFSFWEAGISFVQNVGNFLQAYKCHNPEESPIIFHHPKNFKIHIFFLIVRQPLVGLDFLFGDSSITIRHTTLGRTPLDEWSARRKAKFISLQIMFSDTALVICATSLSLNYSVFCTQIVRLCVSASISHYAASMSLNRIK